ncbi:protein-disulfide reductase DsbD domain-containing protein [Bradyrhizobium sp. WD16]|uniref:protein-disulfide reductase DsbD domain-containing protein n=1 Tax=Bradyrhizobium sp. WD16 TaxID=1521768 RepID=UPI0020A5C345|nr:protein-disulfide reductase DsbD domain-containing protein [Bradyrhizobium sp. WD16]UTD27232.1 cytochrome C biogenesis protein [Bradyrhizobium sp. WD16]
MIQLVPRLPRFALLAFTAPLLLCGEVRAQSADASAWVKDAHSALRLVAGSRNGAILLGGLALKLDSGWKTYWRTPGDSGVPPRFDFSRSDNVASVTVLWPAPTKFPDGAGGTSYGYRNDVLLPLRITPVKPERPVVLRAEVSYAVCEKLCVPVDAKAEVGFANEASSEDGALMTALAAVPQPAKLGDPNALTIRDVRRDGNQVVVDTSAPDGVTVDLFAEGPTADWSLPSPEPLERLPGGNQRFRFALDGLPLGIKPDGAALKLTLTGGGRAREFEVRLN